MLTNELREKYLAFFESKGHKRIASDVLVPTWDPSVLFTPAGMNQFKDHFLGKVKLEFTTATTCQKCLRTGDIDNVGRTPRHHTFFEMLGNFSFGDYFKREAINWAWEFLTDKKWLGLAGDRLHVTVYQDDDEAADIWRNDVGLTVERIKREGEDENFWPASAPSQGPDGVCGPCSEIYYTAPGCPELEIWNLVFTQFNRVGDPPNNLKPLPSKNIDTGMGLERTAATLQGVETNYHIDILKPIVLAAAEVCGVKYDPTSDNGRRLRRITDHVRACTFAVHENVYPGPNKEKYVVKRLLRRAVLDGHQMGVREPFLHQLVPMVAQMMHVPYPELGETVGRVASVIQKEEANFFGTIDEGLSRMDKVFEDLRRDNRTAVEGQVAAELYQTFGVPPELFEALAAERKIAFDWPGYHAAMEEHGELSGKVQHTVMGAKGPLDALKQQHGRTEFLGYDATTANAKVLGIVSGEAPNEQLLDTAPAGEAELRVVLDRTPFYGESGGQVGDTGKLIAAGCEFTVTDTQKDGELFVHYGKVTKGTLASGAQIEALVETGRRDGIRRAHSATHILHYALQKNVGSHAQQQGSKVDADWLRFDFTNLSPVTTDQLAAITRDVAERITAAEPVKWETLPLAEARKAGAMMLFGEKYPDPVQMVSMGAFSRELCGGTHLTNTQQVQQFEVLSEEGVSAGTRRIVALTGARAAEHAAAIETGFARLEKLLGAKGTGVIDAVTQLVEKQRGLKKVLSGSGKMPDSKGTGAKPQAAGLDYAGKKQALAEAGRLLSTGALAVAERVETLLAEVVSLEKQLATRDAAGPLTGESLLEKSVQIAGTTVVIAETPGVAPNTMRQLIDAIRQKTQPAAVLLASASGDDKVTLIAGITKDLQDRGLSAGKWISPVAEALGGGGGGRPDLAQAGGKHPEKLTSALAIATETITAMLA